MHLLVGFMKKFKNCFIILVCLLTVAMHCSPVFANIENANRNKISKIKRNIEFKRTLTRKKINELKRREKLEINKLSGSQQQLETTQNSILTYQQQLEIARATLNALETRMNRASADQIAVANKAGERIKQIYKGERVTVLHLIFSAKDINSFMDRIYYQKRLASCDKNLLIELRKKTWALEKARQSVEDKKDDILSTISIMNQKKQEIAVDINESQTLIGKLRTDRATFESAEKDLAARSNALERMLAPKLSLFSKHVSVKTGFARPLSGMLTSPFGWRRHPIFGSRSFHSGVDIAAPYSSTIRASNNGTVVYSGWYGGYGKVVILSHGDYKGTGTSTLYAHLSSFAVRTGQSVQKGSVIAYEGTTGYSTGPHLHFEVRLNGKPTNPLSFIP